MLPAEFTERFGIEFQTFQEDGWGTCLATIAKIGGTPVLLEAFPEGPELARYITVSVRAYEEEWDAILGAIVTAVNVPLPKMLWIQRELKPAQWLLMRMDDVGNEAIVLRFPTRLQAEHAARAFEKRGHKQTYWVRAAT